MNIDLGQLGLDTDRIADEVIQSIADRADQLVRDAIAERVDSLIEERARAAIDNMTEALLEHQYQPVDQYGRRGEPRTIRQTIIDAFQRACTYDKSGDSWSKNQFTKIIDSALDSTARAVAKDVAKQVDATFTSSVIEQARAIMAQRLGIAK